MLTQTKSAAEKRQVLRAALKGGGLLQFPGAFSPLVALTVQDLGFDGIYVSGGGLSADLALPDIGLTTLPEVAERGRQIARVTDLPSIVDADTGFGEPLNAARTVQVLEDAGLSGLHLEDQTNPKRCGHLDNKAVIPVQDAVQRIRAAVQARRDPNFLIIARTDACASEGLEAGIERARAYAAAGADMVFPDALVHAQDFQAFHSQVPVPLMANMTEFGKSPLLDTATLTSVGVSLVIYPVTALRLAMKAVTEGLAQIKSDGHQRALLERMQTRAELYDLLRYDAYNRFDDGVFNFTTPEGVRQD